MNIAFIPARAGSKGIVRKNLRYVAGKPLLAWTILQALNSECVDRVIVSTDAEEIADVARSFGAECPFLRPPEISGDQATTEAAMDHGLKWLQEQEGVVPRNIILLQPTSPIRSQGRIDKVFKQFAEEKADSLLTVCQFRHFLWKNPDNPEASYDVDHRPRRQELSASSMPYKENGSIYISEVRGFLTYQNRLFGKISLSVMPEVESYEIDQEHELIICDAILAGGHHEN